MLMSALTPKADIILKADANDGQSGYDCYFGSVENYRYQIASDVQRDGLGLELITDDYNIVAEVFRSDKEKTLTDKVIDKTMNKLMKAYENELGAIIRK